MWLWLARTIHDHVMKLPKVCDCDKQKEEMVGRGRLDLVASGRAKSTDKGRHIGPCQQWAEVPNTLTPCYNSIKSVERESPKRRAQSLAMAVGLIKGATKVWLYLPALPSLSRWENTAKANTSITMTLDFPASRVVRNKLWGCCSSASPSKVLLLEYFLRLSGETQLYL